MIISDSKYVVGAIENRLTVWENNGWRDSKGKEVQNREAYERLIEAKEGLEARSIHVKGHQGHRSNEQADWAAKEELRRNLLKCGAVGSIAGRAQEGDENLRRTIEAVERGEGPKRYLVKGGKLWCDNGKALLLVVGDNQKEFLLQLAHEHPIYGAHQGIKGTRKKLTHDYWEGI